MKQRSYRQIEDSRDKRLWMTQVFIPLATLVVILYTNESSRAEFKALASIIKTGVENKIAAIRTKIGGE